MELEDKCESLEAFADSLEAESKLAMETHEGFAGGLRELREQLQLLTDELETRRRNLESAVSKRQQIWEDLRAQYASGELIPSGAAAHLEEEKATLTARVAELESQVNDAQRAQQAEAQQAQDRMREEMERASAALEEAQQRIAALESALSERNVAVERAEKRADEIEDNYEKMLSQSGNTEERVTSLLEELDLKKHKIAELTEAADHANRELQAARQASEQAAKNASDARAALHIMAADMEATEGRFNVWKSRAEEAETALAVTSQELEALRNEHGVAVTQNKSQSQMNESLRNRITELEQLLEEAVANTQVAALHSQLEKERTHATILQETLDEERAQGTKAGLARQLAAVLRDAEEAREELHKLKHEIGKGEWAGSVEDAPVMDRGGIPKEMAPTKRKNLAEALLAAGVLSPEQLHRAQAEQKTQPDSTLPTILLHHNMVDEQTLAEIIAIQSGTHMIDLNASNIQPDAVQALPERVAHMHCCIPIRMSDNQVEVAMLNPGNLMAIEDIERVTGKQVNAAVAVHSALERAIADQYHQSQ